MRKSLIALPLAIVLLTSAPAFGDSSNGNGKGNGNSQGSSGSSARPAPTPSTAPTNPSGQSQGSGSNNSGKGDAASGNSESKPASGNSESKPASVSQSNPGRDSNGQSQSATNAQNNVVSGARMQPQAASAAARAVSRAAVASRTASNGAKARAAAQSACLRDNFNKIDRRKAAKTGASTIIGRPTAEQVRDADASCDELLGDRGDYIVVFEPGTAAKNTADKAKTESARSPENQLQVKKIFTNVFPGMVVRASVRQIEALEKNPNVRFVEPDGVATSTATQTPAPWGLDRIDQTALPMDGSFTYEQAGSNVDVYVIDTGIRVDQVDFAGRVGSGFSSIADGRGVSDCNGHGTHVAGTSVGTIYGVAKAANVIPIRVLDCNGSGTWSGVISGLDWLAGHHAAGRPAVANMSLGGGASRSVDAAVNSVIQDGVSVVVAAGNSAADACQSSPARVAAAITVAASDNSDSQASFSNYGSCVDVYAPGVGITSAWISSATSSAVLSGTSMASPHVAGVVAQILSANLAVTPADVALAVIATATFGAIKGVAGSTPNLLVRAVSSLSSPPEQPTPDPEEPTPDPSATVPSAPLNVAAIAGVRSASVTWKQGSDGGSAVTSQTVWVFDNRGKRIGSVSVAGDVTSVVVSGLPRRKAVSFSVQATNLIGVSPESAQSAPVTIK